eukprot:4798147-Amphidinium_carterae.1
MEALSSERAQLPTQQKHPTKCHSDYICVFELRATSKTQHCSGPVNRTLFGDWAAQRGRSKDTRASRGEGSSTLGFGFCMPAEVRALTSGAPETP